jgi:O-succinylbenzoate synthase
MIRPTDVEVWEVELPLRRPLSTAAGTTTARRSLLVRVATDAVEGWGEAAPQPTQTRDTIEEAWELLLAEAGRILGAADPVLIEGSAATSALDQAVTALQASAAGQSLPDYVGGSLDAVPASAAIGLPTTTADLIGAVANAADAGYRHVKLKIAPGRIEDITTVRKRFPELGIAVDGNGSFGRSDFDDLLDLDTLDLDYIEQPLSMANLSGHIELQRRMGTRICLDESIRRLGDIVTVASAGAARAISLKPGRLGPTLTARGLTLAARHGLEVKIGGLIETGVGKHHLVALATHPAVSLPSDLAASQHWFAVDVVEPEWQVEDGMIHARALLTVDRDTLEQTTIRRHRFHR